MDRFQAMQAFTRIVELGAFGKAADSLELPRASVTQAIQQLEAHLGVQLLQRTTRQVSLTLDGQAYYERCVRLLADLEEAESCFPRVLNNPRGRLRVDLPGALGRMRVIPFLPEFCERYPELELQLSSNDRLVDLLREGADCVLRVGELHDSSLVGRHLADLPQVTCASAAYGASWPSAAARRARRAPRGELPVAFQRAYLRLRVQRRRAPAHVADAQPGQRQQRRCLRRRLPGRAWADPGAALSRRRRPGRR